MGQKLLLTSIRFPLLKSSTTIIAILSFSGIIPIFILRLYMYVNGLRNIYIFFIFLEEIYFINLTVILS